MNSVILKKRKTDAILIGYYLISNCNWKHTNRGPAELKIIADNSNQEVNWYKRNGDFLLIFAVGGKDNFENVYKKYVKDPLLNYDGAGNYSKLVIIRDKDDNSIQDLVVLNNRITGFDSENQKWKNCTYLDNFSMEQTIDVLTIIIPTDGQGALENVLLSSLSEDDYDKSIVRKSSMFIDGFENTADKYISSKRLKIKAKLGTTLAVIFPDRVFSEIDEFLLSVDWNKYEIISNCFGLLKEI